MLFHRCQDAKVSLDPAGIVVTDITLNHLDELLLAGKTSAIIAFPLQNAPKSLHRAIVNTVRHTGHTLCHPSLLKFVVKSSAGVLESSVAVKQGVDIWIRFNRLVKGFIHKWVVIMFTECIGHNTPVTEIQDCAQIELVYHDSLIPFELGYISKPLLVWSVCIELAVQKIFGNILRIFGPPGATTVIVFHRRAYIPGPADS